MVQGKLRRWTDVVQTPSQTGRIGGLRFERVYIKGTGNSPIGPMPVHGFVYAGVDQGTYIVMEVEDAGAGTQATLPVAEAAVLTFARR